MKNVLYLCLYKGPVRITNITTFIDWLIHYTILLVTHSRVSHNEILINTQSYSASIMDKGVRSKWIDYTNKKWIIYETDHDSIYALNIYKKYKDYKYDVKGVLSFCFSWVIQSSNKVFCSELAAYMLNLPNKIHTKLPHRTSPGHLHTYCINKGYRQITDVNEIKKIIGKI